MSKGEFNSFTVRDAQSATGQSSQCAQATNEELCALALAHYDHVSTVAHEWNNQIPQAIKAWYAAKAAPLEITPSQGGPTPRTDEQERIHGKSPLAANHAWGWARLLEQQASARSASVSSWISVKDRLPEKDGTYFVLKDGDATCEANTTPWYKGEWIWNDGSIIRLTDPELQVEFWMPIPEKPNAIQ